MKKIISLILALLLLCGTAVWAVSGFFSLEAEADGRRITVKVTLNEEITAENATVLQGQLIYDPDALTPVSVNSSDNYAFLNCTISEREPRVQFGAVDSDSLPLTLPAGILVTAVFDACTEEAEFCLELDLQTADGAVVADLTDYCTVAIEEVRENPFTDVPKDSYYYEPVLWAVENGITNGASATTFNPGGDLLRAQVVTMLWRHAGSPVVQIDNPFTDVKAGKWYYDAVLWAVSEGITNGTSSTTFAPYGVTNRAQVVTFLWRYLDSPEAGAANPFEDVDASDWYGAAVLWAVENGITYGMSATEFGVNTNCNRAHMVTFLYRAMN